MQKIMLVIASSCIGKELFACALYYVDSRITSLNVQVKSVNLIKIKSKTLKHSDTEKSVNGS